jgi:two-component system nitrogen regulation sensor histidine kinase NtrY
VIALTILMASVLIGLNFANWLVAPIRNLMSAASIVSTGDLHVQVPVHQSEGDLAQLGQTFNKMTQELRTQRDELVSASDLIDSRRRFIEAVLSSASAGIIGVDASGSVGILNRSAEKLIGHAESETLDHPLSDVLPELDDMMKTAREGTQRLVQGQITIMRDGHERNLSVRVSAEQTSQSRDSYIITLDDITELVSAQRVEAWSEVARRLAHEIKNPLTPIQLSAERLQHRLSAKLEGADQAMLARSVDMIVNQVQSMKTLVNEFRDYARLPSAHLVALDLNALVTEVLGLYGAAQESGRLSAHLAPDLPQIVGDHTQLRQVIHNLVQNALDAVAEQDDAQVRLVTEVARTEQGTPRVVRLHVRDNGPGFAEKVLKRAFEPYVTTKTKGTGLGLAVVKKIADEHGARIRIANLADSAAAGSASALTRGAQVSLSFARFAPATDGLPLAAAGAESSAH